MLQPTWTSLILLLTLRLGSNAHKQFLVFPSQEDQIHGLDPKIDDDESDVHIVYPMIEDVVTMTPTPIEIYKEMMLKDSQGDLAKRSVSASIDRSTESHMIRYSKENVPIVDLDTDPFESRVDTVSSLNPRRTATTPELIFGKKQLFDRSPHYRRTLSTHGGTPIWVRKPKRHHESPLSTETAEDPYIRRRHLRKPMLFNNPFRV